MHTLHRASPSAALLARQAQDDKPKLPALFKLMTWCDAELESCPAVSAPSFADLGMLPEATAPMPTPP